LSACSSSACCTRGAGESCSGPDPVGVGSRAPARSATIGGVNQLLLVIAVALTTGAIVFGVIALLAGDDGGLRPAEPDGRAIPLPVDRPLIETDVTEVRFDTAVRGYRMGQVGAALRRLAYDDGSNDEPADVLQAEVDEPRAG